MVCSVFVSQTSSSLFQCTFSIDDRIAWGLVKVKDEVMQGKVVDEWYPLSGKQGDGKEGMIHLIIQYKVRNERFSQYINRYTLKDV